MWSSESPSERKGKRLHESNFAQTCNLLSRYVKEKGTLRDLNLEIGGKIESLETLVKPGSSLAAASSVKSASLRSDGKSAHSSLEHQIVAGEDASSKATTSKEGATKDPKSAQLTIFYSGKVLVFDDYPADKVRDLVHVAKKSSSQMSYGITSRVAPQEKPSPVASTSKPRERLPPRPQAAGSKQPVNEKTNPSTGEAGPSSSKAQEELSPPPEGNGSDLPIARRSSLHRFLEKRKDRAVVRGPYQNQENLGPLFKGDEHLDLNNFPH